jgi:hypothetical protein
MPITCQYPAALTAACLARPAQVLWLSQDAAGLAELRERFPGQQIADVAEAFHAAWERLRKPLLVLGAQWSARSHGQPWWWASHLASRRTTALPGQQELALLLVAVERIRQAGDQALLFVVTSPGLAQALAAHCRRAGIRYAGPGRAGPLDALRLGLRWARRLIGYWRLNRRWFRAVAAAPPPRPLPTTDFVLLRSWMAPAAPGGDATYRDRDFTFLPAWLRARGQRSVVLPMLIDPSGDEPRQVARLRALEQDFVFAHQWLSWRDVLRPVAWEWRGWRRLRGVVPVAGLDAGPLLRWHHRQGLFDPQGMLFALVYPLLRRWAAAGIRPRVVLTSFENSTAEKLLLLGVHDHLPGVPVVGYQHTVWLTGETSQYLAPGDVAHFPLPDRIVTLGPAYLSILTQQGFPAARLAPGPALRFQYVRELRPTPLPAEPLTVFFPLPYDDRLCLDVLPRLLAAWRAAGEAPRLLLKLHPRNAPDLLARALRGAPADRCEVVTQPCPEVYPRCHLVVTCGTSVVALEAIAAGRPVVRVKPLQQPFFDPMGWLDYPVPVALREAELVATHRAARRLTEADLARLAGLIPDYFAPADDQHVAALAEPAPTPP